jgi:hypothetical protein
MLSAAYPNWNPNAFTVEVYYQDLQDIPADLLEVAARHCRTNAARDQRFAPSAGEIRGAVSDIKRQAQGVPSAIEAWGELMHVPTNEQTRQITDEKDESGSIIINITPYQWSHPLVRKVAVMMGFPRFPDWNSESYERTAFIKAYEIELQSYLKQDNQLPAVTQYIESKQHALPMDETIKQLTKGMERNG